MTNGRKKTENGVEKTDVGETRLFCSGGEVLGSSSCFIIVGWSSGMIKCFLVTLHVASISSSFRAGSEPSWQILELNYNDDVGRVGMKTKMRLFSCNFGKVQSLPKVFWTGWNSKVVDAGRVACLIDLVCYMRRAALAQGWEWMLLLLHDHQQCLSDKSCVLYTEVHSAMHAAQLSPISWFRSVHQSIFFFIYDKNWQLSGTIWQKARS